MTVKSFANVPITNEMKARNQGPEILRSTIRLLATRHVGEVQNVLRAVLKHVSSETYHHPDTQAARWLVS